MGNGSTDELLKLVRRNKGALKRWRQTKALLIDEISMMDRELFDSLSAIGSKVRRCNAPFGGIQVWTIYYHFLLV